MGQALGDAGNEACRRTDLPCLEGEHLMQRAAQEPPMQHAIGLGMTERHAIEACGILMPFDPFDAAAQTRKRVRACAGHAPLLKKSGAGKGF